MEGQVGSDERRAEPTAATAVPRTSQKLLGKDDVGQVAKVAQGKANGDRNAAILRLVDLVKSSEQYDKDVREEILLQGAMVLLHYPIKSKQGEIPIRLGPRALQQLLEELDKKRPLPKPEG